MIETCIHASDAVSHEHVTRRPTSFVSIFIGGLIEAYDIPTEWEMNTAMKVWPGLVCIASLFHSETMT